jgi:AmmeMemoRadiSam system radical SAM enzyme/AmmeMemoRadiSam system protein B/AmmeMemoRadiSam system protein A
MKTRVANETLADLMDRYTTAAAPELVRAEGDRLRCLACGHRCLIGAGRRGICKVRFHDQGRLRVPFGYVAGLQCDPVEKKPFFHVYPGSDALTFGMLGCDLHCDYCQNWLTSQALRDANAVAPLRPVTPAQLVEAARREGARLVVSSYNEPLITAEWAVRVFQEAHAAGLACAFVSNGNATPEVLDFLRPHLVAYKVDLKSFNDRNYRSLGGTLDNITETIRMIHERGLWLEVVTLVVPGFNDSDAELRAAARFLASVSPDIPWHVTAFHQDYKMTDPGPTPAETLIRAAEIGTAEGLRFVYAGNLPGRVGPWEDTRCPSCRATLIERYGFLVRSYRITPDGRCPQCQARIPGVWPGAEEEVRTGHGQDAYRDRLPRRVAAPLPVVEPPPQGGTRAMTPTSQASPPSRPELTAEQKEQLVAATAAMLRAAAAGQTPTFPAALDGLGEQLLAGAFISLKRGRHLRGCCGLFGQPVSLARALEHAAMRTVWEDARFPPVSPAELEHLEMEVWLLFAPEQVAARGEERLRAITVGRHGVQIIQGEARGLFLPSVAVENGWDARRLLHQVCLKAGLPASAWRDDASTLFRFEGESLCGRLAGPDSAPALPRQPGPWRAEDAAAYAEFSRNNLLALLSGATPSYYFWGAPDGNLNGIVLHLQAPGLADALHFSQFSLRPGVPLQATLYSLIQAAAQHAAQRLPGDVLSGIQVGVTFLHGPMLHGTVADPHLAGFDPRQRALLVMERNRSALLFDPERAAEELLAEAAEQARVMRPAAASVCSLDALSSLDRVRVAVAPQPVRGPAVRPPAVAGKFYEADPEELARTVDRLLEGECRPEPWPAAMVPHAGLRFSGHIAADVLKRIQIPQTVIVLGPKHTPRGVDWAVAPHRRWEMPGFHVESDFVLARRLCQAILGLELDAAAHQREHAIEVELPFLARLAPGAKVVGIAIGHGDLESCRRFAAGLAGLLRERAERTLLLISSDMNHFATDAENRRLDALALAALERGDPEEVYETVTDNHISMCGVLPAVIVLETLRRLGARPRAKRVGYATSADVTGDPSRVVGYAGMLFG